MRERRAGLEGEAGDRKVLELLREHTRKANVLAEDTLAKAKKAMRLDFVHRELVFK
jgi:tryptophanyl-tRNA synthetase